MYICIVNISLQWYWVDIFCINQSGSALLWSTEFQNLLREVSGTQLSHEACLLVLDFIISVYTAVRAIILLGSYFLFILSLQYSIYFLASHPANRKRKQRSKTEAENYMIT